MVLSFRLGLECRKRIGIIIKTKILVLKCVTPNFRKPQGKIDVLGGRTHVTLYDTKSYVFRRSLTKF